MSDFLEAALAEGGVPEEDFEAAARAAGGVPEEQPSILGSVLRGALAGGSLGFGDEIAGGVSAAGQFLNPFGDSFADVDKVGENYETEQRRILDENKRFEAANPVSYFLGDLLSPSPIGKLRAGTSLVRVLGRGAAESGLATVGQSEGDLTAGQLALGTGAGTVLPAAGAAARAAQPLAQRATPAVIRGFTNVFTGTNPAHARRYQANPARVDSARPFDEIAVDLQGRAGQLQRMKSEASTAGFEALPLEGRIPVSEEADALRRFIATNERFSGQRDSVALARNILGDLEASSPNRNNLGRLRQELAAPNLEPGRRNEILRDLMSEEQALALAPRDAKSVIMRSIDPAMDGQLMADRYIEPGIRELDARRTTLNQKLRGVSDDYANVMDERAAPLTRLATDLTSRNLPARNTELTAQRLATLGSPAKDPTAGPARAVIDELSHVVPGQRPGSLMEEASDRVALESFGKTATAGSRRVKAFSDIFGAPGKMLKSGLRMGSYASAGGFLGPVGAAGGAILALSTDIYGPRIGQTILRNTDRISDFTLRKFQHAERVFNAFEGSAGRAGVNAMHRMMIERDPEYRSAWEEIGALAMEDPAAPSDVVDESAIMDTGSPLLVEQEGEQAKAANHFILMETDEEYRKQYLEDQGLESEAGFR